MKKLLSLFLATALLLCTLVACGGKDDTDDDNNQNNQNNNPSTGENDLPPATDDPVGEDKDWELL